MVAQELADLANAKVMSLGQLLEAALPDRRSSRTSERRCDVPLARGVWTAVLERFTDLGEMTLGDLWSLEASSSESISAVLGG